MGLTPEQVKGRIKNIARTQHTDARVLMRLYMMERYLERIACSRYKDDFIVKGGILVTAMVGVSLRSTMDIDASIRGWTLSAEEARRVAEELCAINLDDGVTFEVKDTSSIMDNMEYPGIRITLNALMGPLVTPMKIDISTGDVITPRAIEYQYPLMLENRSIQLWSYNLETILGEKLQTILARGLLNTRMRDYYDIYTLLMMYATSIDMPILQRAFTSTCEKRGTQILASTGNAILQSVRNDPHLRDLWQNYQQKYSYATDIAFENVIDCVEQLYEMASSE